MIDIGNATLRWKGGRVWVTAGDDRLRSGECGQPIGGLSDAMAAAWLAVTDGCRWIGIRNALVRPQLALNQPKLQPQTLPPLSAVSAHWTDRVD